MLGTSLYELDRFDARVSTTLNGALQQQVSDFLDRLADPEVARSIGLFGERMLTPAGLAEVRYSFTLVESTADGNRVRVQTDTTDQPLDINEGSKLELGSTAKLRTLATYLEIVAELHQKLSDKSATELRRTAVDSHDRISAWAVEYLAGATDRSLPAMLQAALERRYSASPAKLLHRRRPAQLQQLPARGRRPGADRARSAAGLDQPGLHPLMRDIVRYTMYKVPAARPSC
jgi:membrane peptidoglycan carboxypeptidase